MNMGNSRRFSIARRIMMAGAVSAWLMGCATLSSRNNDEADGDQELTQLETDPILIRATIDGEMITTESLDAEEVFQKGFYDYQARRYEDALEQYRIIIDYLPDSRFHLPALYNGGLASEQLEQWRNAADIYARILEEYADSSEALNARFRLANALHELKDYRGVDELLTEILLRDDLSHFDRVEAHVRRGQALLELEEWSDAENSFRNVLEVNARATRGDQLAEESRFMVQTHFGIGKAHHGRMNEIALVLPPARMSEDLETKADHHQRAQVSYIRALRQHHPYWSVAAGYMIGRLYQDFYMDIFTAEIPDDLSELELSVYFEELRNKTRVLMDRALNVYERNLSFSRRMVQNPEAEEWVDATALHLSRMRAFLDDPLVMERAEELVIAGGNLEDLWDTSYFAKREVENALQEAKKATRSDEVAQH